MFKSLRRFIGKAYNAAKVFGRVSVKPVYTESQTKYPPGVQSMLNEYGNGLVSDIKVCRKVVSSATETILNLLSLGKWNEAKRKYGYDRFFHLYMTFNVNGKPLMLEKNQVMNLSSYPVPCDDSMDVSPGGTFTLNQMMNNGRKYMGDNKFFPYSALENNCQNFILGILRGNNLSNSQIESFVYQDISKLVGNLPSYVAPVAKALTDVAATIDTGLQKTVANIDGVENTSDAS